jgi:GalNAc-alpha-(1->4)-GalNAc-alpha-(1->3)-diNAcBac-PP-undecaprenol alpha-1,4-N-acetyl-D-galactosaminyltransferase
MAQANGASPSARIAVVINSLAAGGAERVISMMASYWADKGRKVILITLASTSDDFFCLDNRVTRIALNVSQRSPTVFHAVGNNIRRLVILRSAIRASEANSVIAFIDKTNVLVLLATRALGIPVIISERVDPRHHSIGPTWAALRKLTYRWADALVVQTEAVSQWARHNLSAKKILVIPNAVASVTYPVSKQPHRRPILVAMGRLSYQKGFDMLLRAAATILPRHPSWSIVVLGEGSERASLEQLVVLLGLQKRVSFVGREYSPASVLRDAEIFVLPSRFEGFPNALCEAMASGLPVVSFDCPSGPREIVRDGIDGLLVPPDDINGLASAMEQLITHPQNRREMGLRAAEIALRFSPERIMGLWEHLLVEVSRNGHA